MIKPFDFYFDFVSPYSFLAHKQIRKIEKKEGIKIRYKPILVGGLHNLHGIKAPAFIPAKAKHHENIGFLPHHRHGLIVYGPAHRTARSN